MLDLSFTTTTSLHVTLTLPEFLAFMVASSGVGWAWRDFLKALSDTRRQRLLRRQQEAVRRLPARRQLLRLPKPHDGPQQSS